jgi:hypothetical protein
MIIVLDILLLVRKIQELLYVSFLLFIHFCSIISFFFISVLLFLFARTIVCYLSFCHSFLSITIGPENTRTIVCVSFLLFIHFCSIISLFLFLFYYFFLQELLYVNLVFVHYFCSIISLFFNYDYCAGHTTIGPENTRTIVC